MATLKEVRRRKGLYQKALADLAQVTAPTLSSIENGHSYASAVTRARIQSIIGPVDWCETRLQSLGIRGHQPQVADEILRYVLTSPEADRADKIKYLRKILDGIENQKII